jgi:hypothetical protein
MPFDCSPTIESPKQSHVDASNVPDLGIDRRSDPFNVRPIPAWHATRRPESIGTSLAVLGLARQLITDERRWCQGAFARTWLSAPVPTHWVLARRFCALGAIRRAGRELQLRTPEACMALEWQTVRPIHDWNDDPKRTHADVIAAFDRTITVLEASAA